VKAWVAAAVLTGILASAGPLCAQSGDPHDEVYDLATVEADHALCGFALTDEQQDVIAQRRDALITRGDVTEGEIAAVREQVSAALASQKAEGLCRPDGPEAKAYKRRLTTLGLL
jgi:hypothetical protein